MGNIRICPETAYVDNVLSTIGNTPLIRLSRLMPDAGFEVYAKLEGMNPGGSAKDRPALNIIRRAVEAGKIRPGTVVIESSSGNMGIGISQVCRYYGLRFICVVDSLTTRQHLLLLEAYGAEIEIITDDGGLPGGLLRARLARVQELCSQYPDSYWVNQYANPDNFLSHYHNTAREIFEALGGQVDYLFCPTSTCGILRGCTEYVRAHKLTTKIFAIDAEGSSIFAAPSGKRLLPGHGAGRRPELCSDGLLDELILVSDADCVRGCRTLIEREAILAGASSGATVAALERMRLRIDAGQRCALIFVDRGERYLDTVYSDDWVAAHLGTDFTRPQPEHLLVDQANG